ncbi:MAG: hypothetical protein ABTQ31_09070 [Rhizobiaceae bacterium]
MSGRQDGPSKPKGQRARLAEALRQNLQRRKTQARSRDRIAGQDEPPTQDEAGAQEEAATATGERENGPENAG